MGRFDNSPATTGGFNRRQFRRKDICHETISFRWIYFNISLSIFLAILIYISVFTRAYSYHYVHFTRISESLQLPPGIAHSFATLQLIRATEILDHARELNRSTLSKVAVAVDNGKSKIVSPLTLQCPMEKGRKFIRVMLYAFV